MNEPLYWDPMLHLEEIFASQREDEREAATGLLDYLAYLDGNLKDHLRAYCYFLDNRESPQPGDHLPPL